MNYQALISQAAELAHSGQYPELETVCRKILKKKPKHFDALQLLGLAQSRTGQISEAITHLRRARKLNPQHASVRVNLANACLEKGSIDEAIKFSQEALKLDASNYAAQLALGNGLQMNRRFEEAEQAYQQALKILPASAEVIDNLGECYRKQGRLSEAVTLFLQANDINPDLPKVYIHLFKTLLLMQVTDDALKVANAGLGCANLSATDTYELLIGKAKIAWLIGDLKAAQDALEHTRRLAGLNTVTYGNLANLQAYESCLKELLQERSLHPELYQQKAEKAIFFIAESHALSPSEVVVNYRGVAHKILSTLITGSKAWHLTSDNLNEYQASLDCFLSAIPPRSIVVLGFGEIDCRVSEGILKAHHDKNIDYHQSISQLVEDYLNSLIRLAEPGQHEMILYGVPAPNTELLSPQDKKHQDELCEVVRLFNQHLQQSGESKNLEFLDVYDLTVGDNGESNQQYHIDGHHLHPKVFPELFDRL